MSSLGTDAKDLIARAGHADDPSDADRERIRRTLALTLGGATVVSTTAAAAKIAVSLPGAGAAGALAAPTAWIAPIALWFGLGAAAGLGVVVLTAPEPTAPPTTAALPSRLVPHGHESAHRLAPAASFNQPSPSASPPASPVSEAFSTSKARRSVEPSARAPKAPPITSEIGRARPSATADPPVDSLSEEIHLLGQAQRARAAGRCEVSLNWLAQYALRFPRGALKSESITVEVLCLCELNRDAEAKARAAPWMTAAPDSALAQRLQRSCAGTGSERF